MRLLSIVTLVIAIIVGGVSYKQHKKTEALKQAQETSTLKDFSEKLDIQKQEISARKQEEGEKKETAEQLLILVKKRLKDPDSAKFQNVKIIKATYDVEKTKTAYQICGEVNSKNSYGGYVGFHGFAVANNIHAEPTVYMQDDDILRVIWQHIAKETGCI
jgi:hypothetical protein